MQRLRGAPALHARGLHSPLDVRARQANLLRWMLHRVWMRPCPARCCSARPCASCWRAIPRTLAPRRVPWPPPSSRRCAGGAHSHSAHQDRRVVGDHLVEPPSSQLQTDFALPPWVKRARRWRRWPGLAAAWWRALVASARITRSAVEETAFRGSRRRLSSGRPPPSASPWPVIEDHRQLAATALNNVEAFQPAHAHPDVEHDAARQSNCQAGSLQPRSPGPGSHVRRVEQPTGASDSQASSSSMMGVGMAGFIRTRRPSGEKVKIVPPPGCSLEGEAAAVQARRWNSRCWPIPNAFFAWW